MSINIKSKLKEKYVIITKILNSINKSRIGEYAAQCSYYTILSFIPFVILLLTLIQYTGINQDTLFNAIKLYRKFILSQLVQFLFQLYLQYGLLEKDYMR